MRVSNMQPTPPDRPTIYNVKCDEYGYMIDKNGNRLDKRVGYVIKMNNATRCFFVGFSHHFKREIFIHRDICVIPCEHMIILKHTHRDHDGYRVLYHENGKTKLIRKLNQEDNEFLLEMINRRPRSIYNAKPYEFCDVMFSF